MLDSALPWIAIALYLIASLGAVRQFWNRSNASAFALVLNHPLKIAFVAWLLHSAYATAVALGYSHGASGPLELNLNLHAMSAVVSAILVGTFLVLCLSLSLDRLAALVFPLAATTLVFSFYWSASGDQTLILSRETALSLKLHVLLSIMAYAFVSLATAQALIFKFQESQFKQRVKPTLLAALPPLETMEQLLFKLLWISVVLLTLTLASGALFSRELFGVPFAFNHHTVLALLGWLVLGATLVTFITNKLNGAQAAKWIVLGFVLIQLGYFGTKIITDLIN